MNSDFDKLGTIVKSARKSNNLTRAQLAEKINITPRYLMSIENENRKPSFQVLNNLFLELGISANITISPEEQADNTIEQLIQLLYQCDENERRIAITIIKALVENK